MFITAVNDLWTVQSQEVEQDTARQIAKELTDSGAYEVVSVTDLTGGIEYVWSKGQGWVDHPLPIFSDPGTGQYL